VTRILAAATVMFVMAACGGDGRLKVFAAASLTEVFERIDPDARYNFAGSDELAAQIRQGAPADVYAAASEVLPDELHADGLIEEPGPFATNRLVLIVPRDNPAGIVSVSDVARPGVKLVIGAEGVPVGDYTRTVLENLNALDVLERVVSEEQDVKAVVGKVALGEADAGFVYATDVQPVVDDVIAIELPAAGQPEVTYAIAVVDAADNGDEAESFVESVLSDRGRRLLQEAGFGIP
jgi:molybdate transport system substrate-binding protein